MSAFRHIDNIRVRPIEEELQEMGLNPDRVLSEIDRQTAMLEGEPPLLDPSGLREGDESPRSLAQYSATLLAEKCGDEHGKGKGKKGKKADDDDEEEDPADSEGMGEGLETYSGQRDDVVRMIALRLAKDDRKEKRRHAPKVGADEEHYRVATAVVKKLRNLTGWEKQWSKIRDLASREGWRSFEPQDEGMGEETELSESGTLGKGYTTAFKLVKSYGFSSAEAKQLLDQWEEGWGITGMPGLQVKDPKAQKLKRELLKIQNRFGKPEKTKQASPGYREDLDSVGDPGLAEAVRQRVEALGLDEEGTEAFLYLLGEGWELDDEALQTEALGVVKKIKGAAARLAKRLRHREYMKSRGTEKRKAKIYRKTHKRQIKRTMTKKLRKYGRKGLEKLHKMGRRIVQRSWDERLANIQEELEHDAALALQSQEPLEESVGELSIVAEAALNASETAWYLGEVFDAMGDEAGQVLFQLSRKALELAEAIDEADEPTDEQEAQLETVLSAVVRALAEHEERGAPSLGEAIGIGMVHEGMGTWDELVEYKPPTPGEMAARVGGKGVARGQMVPAGKTAGPDTSMAGKYLRAVNIAMQDMDRDKAKAAALAVVKKHTVTDSKGKKVTAVKDMADVLRVMYYLSQITGLKAPAWMYRGKQKPWFVTADDVEAPAKPSEDKKMADALKALGAPAGLLKALAAA